MIFNSKKIGLFILLAASTAFTFAKDWYVCLGSFKDEKGAKERVQILSNHGYPAFGAEVDSPSGKLIRVLYSYNFDSLKDAREYKDALQNYPSFNFIGNETLWCVQYSGSQLRYIFEGKGNGQIIKVPVEKIVEKEVIKEVIKEVPVVKTVEVIKEIPVEKIVEKEVIKEVPVEKIVEVVKEVPVEKIVEKEVIKEVPVEKIVEVVKEVPVEKIVEVIKEVPVEKQVEPPVVEEPAPVSDKPFDPEKRILTIKDSDSGEPIPNANVNVDKKWDFTTSNEGKISLPEEIPDGNHSLRITKENEYVPTEQTLTLSDKEIATVDQISIPKAVEYERIKIVLDWGKTPEDLDARLVCGKKILSFKNRKQDNMRLDRDDTNSYGPETITIEGMDSSKVYSYYVADYSNRSSSNSFALGESGAQVSIWLNNDFYKTIKVPKNCQGNVWHVFDVVNNEIVIVDRVSADKIKAAK